MSSLASWNLNRIAFECNRCAREETICLIVAEKCAITADTDLRLCRFFGLSDGFWLRAQVVYDTELARRKLEPELAKITPWKGAAIL